MNRIIATFIATLAITTGCATDGEPVADVDVLEAVVIHDHFDGPVDQLDSGIEVDASELGRLGELDYDVGAPFVRDCNICVRTVNGAVCTAQACDEIDDRASAVCGDQPMGAVWADDCNLCTCTGDGTVCSLAACGGPWVD